MGGRRQVCIVSHRPMANSDLKQGLLTSCLKILLKCVGKPMNPLFVAMKTAILDFMVLTGVMSHEIFVKFLTGYFHIP